MTNVAIELPRDPGELRDRFSRLTAIGIALITMVAAGVGYLQASAVRLGDEAEVEAQRLGVEAFGSLISSEAEAQVQLQTYALSAQQRTLSASLLQESLATAGAHGHVISEQADLWAALAAQAASLTTITEESRFGPEQDLAFPRRFLTEQSQEAFRISALQDAVIEYGGSWGRQAAAYAAILALLAVSVYLFGLSLTVAVTTIRLSFAVTGSAVALAGLVWAAVTLLAPPHRPPDEAADAFAAGRVALLTASTQADYAIAVEQLTAAIAARPSFAQAYVSRATARFLAGSPQVSGYVSVASIEAVEGARADLQHARELGLESKQVLTDLGFFTYLQGLRQNQPDLYEESIRLTRAAIKLAATGDVPADDAVLYGNLGVALLAAGRQAEAEAAYDESILRTIYVDLDTLETRDPGPAVAIASGALSDIEVLLKYRPDLGTDAQALKARFVGAVAHQTPDVPTSAAAVDLKGEVEVVFPGELQFGVDYEGFGATDYLSAYWYYQAPDDSGWHVLPEVSGPLWYLDEGEELTIRTDGTGSYIYLAPLIERSWPPRCIDEGHYRGDIYVNGELAAQVEGQAGWGEMRPLVFRDLGLALCGPPDWHRVGDRLAGFKDGFVSTDGTRGAYVFRVHNPGPLLGDVLDAEVRRGILPADIELTAELDEYFLDLSDAVVRDYAYDGGLVRAKIARLPQEGVALAVVVFGPDGYWTELPACERDDRRSGEACGPLNVLDSVRLFDAVPGGEDEPEIDTANVSVTNVVFALGVTEAQEPTEIVAVAPTAATDLCGFWDYDGMIDGSAWDALWMIDGQEREESSFHDEVWTGGASGQWWVCIADGESPLPDGQYELVINVQSEFAASNSLFVGGEHPLVNLEIVNQSGTDVCYAYLSLTLADNWGPDELGEDELISADESRVLLVPAGTYDLLLEDCSSETLAEEYGLEISEGTQYTVMPGG